MWWETLGVHFFFCKVLLDVDGSSLKYGWKEDITLMTRLIPECRGITFKQLFFIFFKAVTNGLDFKQNAHVRN